MFPSLEAMTVMAAILEAMAAILGTCSWWPPVAQQRSFEGR